MDEPLDPARLERLCDALSLGRLPTPFERGSVFVGHVDDRVLKVFPPGEEAYAATEIAALRALDGALPVATPRVLDAGAFEGHPYVLMTRLPGEELAELWPTLSTAERVQLGRQLGAMIAALHQVPAPPELDHPDWSEWCKARRGGAVETHRKYGCPENVLAELSGFLERGDFTPGPTGFLHTEIMRDHLLVERSASGLRLSGLFDFEPAMVGPADYELASVGLFFSGGEAPVLRAVLEGMGRDPDAPGLSERLMAMFLMHRYCSFKFALSRTDADPERGLSGLTQAWFGLTDDPL